MNAYKECSKCKTEKNINDFYNCKDNKKDGKARWCKECTKKNCKKWNDTNSQKEETKEKRKKYYKKNELKIKKWRSEYTKEVRKNKVFRVNKYMRKKLNLKLAQKNEKYLDCFSPTTSCTTRELKKYIEKKFKGDMTWDNYGKLWSIDHIIPISAFFENLSEERRYINHYLNLQPLLISENIIKGKKYSEQDKAVLIEKINKLNEGGLSV